MVKIVLDCDPGHDDALALMLAQGHPDIDLVGVTLTHGNTSLQNVTTNAMAIGQLIGLEGTPVAAGAVRPLVRERLPEAGIHGTTGLDGPRLPLSELSLDKLHAVDLLIETVMNSIDEEITVIATGPLTNLALAVRKQPEMVTRVREIILMGGSLGVGNRTPVAEFNILSDPEAAHIVFDESWQVTMVGLDTTHQVLATPERIELLREFKHPAGSFAAELLDYVTSTYRNYPGAENVFKSPPVHDLCAVALAADPAAFEVTAVPLTVELQGRESRGMTVPDFRRAAQTGCHTSATTAVDAERVWKCLFTALENL